MSRYAEQARAMLPALAVALIVLLAGLSLTQHLGGEASDEQAALDRYRRIAADLPRLEAALRDRPATPATTERGPSNPSIAAAQWQSRLGQLATAKGLQLASAESLLADSGASGGPAIALELTGTHAAFLAFLYEVERGADPMRVASLEIAPAARNANGSVVASEPQLRIRMRAVPPSKSP